MLQAFGHLSMQMLVHILLMNAVAPVIALAASGSVWGASPRLRSLLFPATVAQLAVLWAWHAPPVLDAVMQSNALHLAMQASLLLVALWFWKAVFYAREDRRWRAILALLVTSKVFCLLGVLLVFAPRALYLGAAEHGAAQSASILGDQQLAGLLMLVACPVTYLIAGTVIAARWLGGMDAATQPVSRRQSARAA
jgi:putative membrane protein